MLSSIYKLIEVVFHLEKVEVIFHLQKVVFVSNFQLSKPYLNALIYIEVIFETIPGGWVACWVVIK